MDIVVSCETLASQETLSERDSENRIKGKEHTCLLINHQYPIILEGYESEILMVGISCDAKLKEHRCRIEKLEQE